jgi:hypothetical protein
MIRHALAGIALAGSCGIVMAQETLLIRPQRAATPASPNINLYIAATFPAEDFAFAIAWFDIEAQEGRFLDAGYVWVQTELPRPEGRFVYDAYPVQLHWPAMGAFADPSNPITVLQTVWRADSFEPHDVLVETINTRRFLVYPDDVSGAAESRIDTFEEGSGIIRVRRCYTDCDGDDETTIFDFLCFLNAFEAGDFYADCDESGPLDIFDFICFQNEFMAGCP